MGYQKNRLIETVLLTTHNICLIREIRNLNDFTVTPSYLRACSTIYMNDNSFTFHYQMLEMQGD